MSPSYNMQLWKYNTGEMYNILFTRIRDCNHNHKESNVFTAIKILREYIYQNTKLYKFQREKQVQGKEQLEVHLTLFVKEIFNVYIHI